MEPGTLMGVVVGILIATVLNAIVIWIVGKLKLGIEINNFGTAFLAAFLIAVVWVLLSHFKVLDATAGGGWLVHLVRLVVSALVLMLVGNMLKGMVTKGFLGAVVAALAMTAVYWLIEMVIVGVAK